MKPIIRENGLGIKIQNLEQDAQNNIEYYSQAIAFCRNELGKQKETNQHYLSKTINFEKKCSFTNYIKNLRVDYAINWINENQGLAKKYTIDAISKEFGFNNPETFSLAFKKKTGFKPSFFIKELTRKV